MAAAASAQLDGLSHRASTSDKARLGFLGRLMRAMQEARMRQAEQEVARLIETRGLALSDETERRLSRHFV